MQNVRYAGRLLTKGPLYSTKSYSWNTLRPITFESHCILGGNKALKLVGRKNILKRIQFTRHFRHV